MCEQRYGHFYVEINGKICPSTVALNHVDFGKRIHSGELAFVLMAYCPESCI